MIEKVKISGYRILRSFELYPNSGLNLLVGANESGKSTILEAMTLALTGRINGRRAYEELNPYWFNKEIVADFIADRKAGKATALPEISIEVFFQDSDDLQKMSGAANSDVPANACPGISMKIFPDPDYIEELEAWAQNPTEILPVEYYMEDWRDFADTKLTHKPKSVSTAIIDSRTVKSTAGVDYHLRDILREFLEPAEGAEISLAYRKSKETLSASSLQAVNDRIGDAHATLHDKAITLAMDQSSRTSWTMAITPHVDGIPFPMSGHGQQASIKIALAMNRHSDSANIVMVEEPENHLSHTSLATLVSRIQKLSGPGQQLFITTHSSFVLNRLGLEAILLVGPSETPRIPDLDPETAGYFQKLPGYDTLRLALADKIVLVEGPSDEIIFERVYRDTHGVRPIEAGVDVVSMRGLSAARCLEFCAALDKKVAALQDNDGKDPGILEDQLANWLQPGRRELFVGAVEAGSTLETQLVHANGEESMRTMLGLTAQADLETWMNREKTEGALRIAESDQALVSPGYILNAVKFIHGQ